MVIIRAFLENLLKKLEETAMKAKKRKADKLLVAQMDRLRKKIGPIGVPVAELVRQGRRQQSPPLNVTRMAAPPVYDQLRGFSLPPLLHETSCIFARVVVASS
jgi:hypothetical protein